jgi:hypothetical protein
VQIAYRNTSPCPADIAAPGKCRPHCSQVQLIQQESKNMPERAAIKRLATVLGVKEADITPAPAPATTAKTASATVAPGLRIVNVWLRHLAQLMVDLKAQGLCAQAVPMTLAGDLFLVEVS